MHRIFKSDVFYLDDGIVMPMESKNYRIESIHQRDNALIDQLLTVWQSAVEATHNFLSQTEIEAIKTYVPQALKGIPDLLLVYDGQDHPIAFMGIDASHIEMLFIHNNCRGQGIGRMLVEYAFSHYTIKTVDVNEDNPQALGFYQHMGFSVESRDPFDGQGNPYPILHMERY